MKPKFNSGNLTTDFDRVMDAIKDSDDHLTPLPISKDFDSNLDYPYILDIFDAGYLYPNKVERDADYEKIRKIANNTLKNHKYDEN